VPYENRWQTVRVTIDDGIAWVELNRPEKRNAMSPTLNAEMIDVLEALDADDDCGVLVLTGAGVSAESGVPTFRGKSGEILPALFGHPKSS